MDRSELLRLLSPEGLALLDSLAPYGSSVDALASVARLRKQGHDAGLVAAVLTQARLRGKAEKKFGPFAERMLFTQAGLEQATRLGVAARHAARFAALGPRRVLDLGCGIGGDALAIAGLDVPVLAIEQDETTAALAAYNLAPFAHAEVVHGDARAVAVEEGDALWLDPARRSEGRGRIDDPEDYEPSLSWALQMAGQHPTGIKLSPAMDRGLLPADSEAQWVSADGSVVELVLWSGALAREGIRRSALVVSGESSAELTAAADSEDVGVTGLGEYLYEPDGSVIRARLIGQLGTELGLGMLSEGIAYLSGDALLSSPFVQGFRVHEVLPAQEGKLKAALRERGIGTLEIKKRGIDIDPAALRTRLGLRGDASATLIMTRDGSKRIAVLAERL